MCCGNGRDDGREMISMKVLVNCDICRRVQMSQFTSTFILIISLPSSLLILKILCLNIDIMQESKTVGS